jgi:transcriptional regulator with XRE-family HTH domain
MAERRVDLTWELASTLRDLRIRAGLSQYKLAEKTGLTRPKIKRIENREVGTMAGMDYDALVRVLGPAKGRKAQAARSAPPPKTQRPKDKSLQAEVDQRVRASVLVVLRDLMGDGARALMESHNLQNVTLSELFAAGK